MSGRGNHKALRHQLKLLIIQMKPQDTEAEAITFGIELETTIPATSGIHVGFYHRGDPIINGNRAGTGEAIAAPRFKRAAWRAERDGSIRVNPGRKACEFVSPVLSGTEGVQNMLDFVAWAEAIGADVNASCGCHITVGVKSIIGTDDPEAMSAFARKLAHIAKWHSMSLYGQTGTGRHLNTYSHVLAEDVGLVMRRLQRTDSRAAREAATNRCGRGMVNFRKLFTHGVIEFRVFAGTLNRNKLLHHLATVLGLCRRAAQVECLGGFGKNKAQAKRTETATAALRFLHDYLGWTGSRRPVALGLFGPLHSEFRTYQEVAERMCRRFDTRFPFVRL